MPTILVKGDCLTDEGKRDLYFRLPVKSGEVPGKVDLAKIHPHMLLHVGAADKADVISWTFGGAQRIVRKGTKRICSVDELGFLLNRYPGLVEQIETKDGSDPEVSQVLAERIKKLERDATVAAAESDALREKLRLAEERADDAERLSAVRTAELDKARSESASNAKEAEQLRQALAKARAAKAPTGDTKAEG